MGTTTTSIRLPDEIKERFEALAATTGRSRNYLMLDALTRYLQEEEWQLQQIEEGIRAADEHPDDSMTHEAMVAGLIQRGVLRQEDLDRAESEFSLEELRRANQW
jgi:RHH-type transcriptional regulator, rel operon repressor / antitoxin RelB